MSQALVTFDEVAVYFSEEEWRTLEEWQKELYKDVMRENYRMVLSLSRPDIISSIELGNDPVVKSSNGKRSLLGNLHQAGHCLKQHEADQELQRGENHQETTGCKVDVMGAYLQRSCEANLGKSAKQPRRYPRVNPIRWVKREKHVKRKGCQKSSAEYMGKAENVPEKPAGGRDASTAGESVICSNDANPGGDHEGAKQDGVGDHPTDVGEFEMDTMIEAHKVDIRPPEKPSTPVTEAQRPGEHNGKSQEKCDTVMCKKSENAIQETSVHRRAVSAAENSEFEELKQGDKARLSEENNVRVANLQDKGELHNDSNKSHGNVHHLVIEDNRAHEVDSTVTKAQHEYDLIGSNDEEDLGTTQILPKFASETQETSSFDSEKISTEATQTHCPRPLTNYHSPIPQILEKDEEEKTTPCKKSKKQRKDRHVTFNETVTMFIIEAREDKFAYNEGLALRSRRLVYTRNLSEEPGVQSIYNERGGKLAIEASVDELNKEIEENTEPVKVTSNPTENWENNMKSGNMSHVSSKSNQKGHRTAIDQLNDERRNMKRTVTYLTADHRRKMQRMVMYNAGEESKKIQRIVTYPTVEERTVMYPSVDQNRKIQRTVMYLRGEESREMESLVTYPSGKESRKMDRTVMYPIGKESRKMQRMVTYPTGEGSRKTQRTVTYPTDDESRKMQRNVIDPTGEKSKKVQMTGTDPNDNESRKMQRTVTDPTGEESRKMQRTVTDPTGEESRRMQRTVTALTHEESRKLQRTVTEPTGEESREMQMTVTDPTDEESRGMQMTVTDPTDEESRGMQMTVTDPTDEESRGMQMTVTDPTDEESRGMQMTVTDPTDNESREMQMTVTDPTDEESREMQMTVTDPTNEESRKMQMTVTDPTGEESKKMQMTVTDTTDNESRKMQRTVTDPTGEESKKMQMTVTDPTDNESMKTQRTVTDPTEESRKMQRTVADPSNEESRKMQATVTDPTEESRKIQMSVTDPTGKETRKMQTTVTDSTGDESRKTQKNLTDPTDEEIGKTQSTVMDLTGEKSRRKHSTVAGRKDEKRQKKQRTVTAYPTGEESRKKKRTNDITSSAITEGTSQNTSPLQDEEAWNANKNSTKHDPTFMNKKESTHLNEKCVMQGTRNEERSQVDADSVQNNSELIKSYSCVNCSKITHWSKLNDLQKSNIGKMPYLCSKCSRMSKIMENASTPVSIKKKRTGKKSSNNRNDSSDPTIEKNKRLKGKKNELHKREESIAGGEGTFPKEINKEEVESADDGADTVATHLRSSREDGLALSLHNNEKMLGLPSIQDVILENTSYSYSKREATGGHHNPNARNNPCKKPKQTDECPNSSPKILQKPGFSSSGSDKEEYEHCVKCGKCKVSVHDKVTWNKKPQMCLRCSKPVQETCTGKIRKCNHYHRAANENFKDTLPSETRDRERNAEETSGGKVEPEKPVTKSGKRCEDCGREANPHTHNQSNLGGNGGWSPKKQSILVKHKRKTREGTEKNCETIRKQRRPSLAKGGPYGCNICGKTFTRKFTALKHRTVHTGEKPFLCQECGKRFRDRGNLQSHMRSHTKEKPYECLECGKCFSQTSSLIVHHRTHTNERPFECTKCGKSFSDRSTFINHKLIHTGLKPFECKYCGKKFTQKSQVVRHEKIHTGEKPHGCSVCGRRFLDRAKLTKHEAIHAKTDARKTLKWE